MQGSNFDLFYLKSRITAFNLFTITYLP